MERKVQIVASSLEYILCCYYYTDKVMFLVKFIFIGPGNGSQIDTKVVLVLIVGFVVVIRFSKY